MSSLEAVLADLRRIFHQSDPPEPEELLTDTRATIEVLDNEPEVIVLKQFRDDYLLTHDPGRRFVTLFAERVVPHGENETLIVAVVEMAGLAVPLFEGGVNAPVPLGNGTGLMTVSAGFGPRFQNAGREREAHPEGGGDFNNTHSHGGTRCSLCF